MVFRLFEKPDDTRDEQLLKLYWNRADVKRELTTVKRERFELLDWPPRRLEEAAYSSQTRQYLKKTASGNRRWKRIAREGLR